jgi:hypothetical protein
MASLVERTCRSDEFATNINEYSVWYDKNETVRFTSDSSQYGETDLLIREIVNRSCRHRVIVGRRRVGAERLEFL